MVSLFFETKRNVFFCIIFVLFAKAKHFLVTFVSEIQSKPSLTIFIPTKGGSRRRVTFFLAGLLQTGYFIYIFAYKIISDYLQHHHYVQEIRLQSMRLRP